MHTVCIGLQGVAAWSAAAQLCSSDLRTAFTEVACLGTVQLEAVHNFKRLVIQQQHRLRARVICVQGA